MSDTICQRLTARERKYVETVADQEKCEPIDLVVIAVRQRIERDKAFKKTAPRKAGK